MPRQARRSQPTKAEQQQRTALWAQDPTGSWATIGNWEPRGEEFTQALLSIMATGATIILRPGSGGGALGIAIWEGDDRHPATWLYEDEAVNEWSATILKRAEEIRKAQKMS